ncbi:hypothetical protein [Micromonospora palythoicola]|uniref:hypothetical protein n=1 Tax=Micromonospora palythoicola TaxID=3120507 RepID=UPI002FCE2205
MFILFIPAGDEGRVLVPISKGHGLSAVDGVGAALLAVGGTWLEVLVVRRLPYLALPPRALFGLGLLAGLGMGLLIASVFRDSSGGGLSAPPHLALPSWSSCPSRRSVEIADRPLPLLADEGAARPS